MSGLDKIISRLEIECENTCNEIALESQAVCEKEIASGNAEGDKKAAEIIKAAEKEAEVVLQKANSQASLNSGRAILEAKLSLINEIVDGAMKKLISLPADEYFELLSRLAKKNARAGKGVLCLGRNDLDRMPEAFPAKLGSDITVGSEPENIDDGFILKYGDIEINCTFKAMFSAARDELKAAAGEILFTE